MHVLIIGAAGMIGRKLTAALVKAGEIGGKPISGFTLVDGVLPRPTPPTSSRAAPT